jgi:quercetin dioxygenase-like cupin family protein
MKITPYAQVQATHFDRDPAKGIAARVVIGKNDGAENFWMRVFEIAPGGHTPRHTHD